MSLYGNVKRVGTSQFQFDREYKSRVEMEAQCATDGVYIGRYVLINYGNNGIRYEKKQAPGGGDMTMIQDGQVYYYIQQTEEYSQSLNEDLEAFGAVYDSTVWQKIYTLTEGEKYIMIAELNAMAPRFEIDINEPLLYKYADNAADAEEVYVLKEQNGETVPVLLPRVQVDYVQPAFDEAKSTESSYFLKMPRSVELAADEQDINYNRNGFNVVYNVGKGTNDYHSYIHWIPEGLAAEDVDQSGDSKLVNKKKLVINLPAFGNVMSELYDLLYGVPGNDGTNVRPFFKKYWEAASALNGSDLTIDTDDESWLSSVPSIGGFLANNTEGLTGLLRSLYTYPDPLSGKVRYYLQCDWTTTYNENSNAAFIDHKPETVGYAYATTTTDSTGTTVKTTAITPSHCYIDFDAWKLIDNLS